MTYVEHANHALQAFEPVVDRSLASFHQTGSSTPYGHAARVGAGAGVGVGVGVGAGVGAGVGVHVAAGEHQPGAVLLLEVVEAGELLILFLLPGCRPLDFTERS